MSLLFPDLASKSRTAPAHALQSPAQLALDIALLMLALLIPTLLAFATEDRLIFGANPWLKPFHFEVSIAIHFATLALLAGLVTPKARDGRHLRWAMIAAGFAAQFEIGYITLQAARGQTSHFNVSSPLASAMYGLMGVGALALVFVSFVLGWQIWRHGAGGQGRGLRTGAILGLMIGSVATLIVAGILSSGTSHWIGGIKSDASGLPLLGWATKGGDLRVSHFFSTHAMQALPLLGWLADRTMPQRSVGIVVAAAVAWAAIIILTFLQALAGQAFLPL